MIPNLAPDEIQCIGCDCIKPADEIDWELFDEVRQIVCIDCVDVVDEILDTLVKNSVTKKVYHESLKNLFKKMDAVAVSADIGLTKCDKCGSKLER